MSQGDPDTTLGFALATSSELTALLSNLNCGEWNSGRDAAMIREIETKMESFERDWDVFKEHHKTRNQ